MTALIIGLVIVIVVLCAIRDYKKSPYCNWCKSRHYGRCMYNPRSGRFFSNCRDGHFDWSDPNK